MRSGAPFFLMSSEMAVGYDTFSSACESVGSSVYLGLDVLFFNGSFCVFVRDRDRVLFGVAAALQPEYQGDSRGDALPSRQADGGQRLQDRRFSTRLVANNHDAGDLYALALDLEVSKPIDGIEKRTDVFVVFLYEDVVRHACASFNIYM